MAYNRMMNDDEMRRPAPFQGPPQGGPQMGPPLSQDAGPQPNPPQGPRYQSWMGGPPPWAQMQSQNRMPQGQPQGMVGMAPSTLGGGGSANALQAQPQAPPQAQMQDQMRRYQQHGQNMTQQPLQAMQGMQGAMGQMPPQSQGQPGAFQSYLQGQSQPQGQPGQGYGQMQPQQGSYQPPANPSANYVNPNSGQYQAPSPQSQQAPQGQGQQPKASQPGVQGFADGGTVYGDDDPYGGADAPINADPPGGNGPGMMQRYKPYLQSMSQGMNTQKGGSSSQQLGGAVGGLIGQVIRGHQPGAPGPSGVMSKVPGAAPASGATLPGQLGDLSGGMEDLGEFAQGGVVLGPKSPQQDPGLAGTHLTEPGAAMRRYEPVNPVAPSATFGPKPEEMGHHLPTKLRIGKRINVRLPRPSSKGLGAVSVK